jgi:DNA repair protein RecO (recombination protein O)
MAMFTDDALVLDSQRYRDRDMLVTLLTAGSGLRRGVLRRARGGKAPQAAAAQILSRVHVTAYSGRRSELATFRQLELVTSSYQLATDLDRVAAAAVVADLLLTFCPPEEPAPRRFRLGVALLEGLLEGVDPSTIVAYAEFWLLTLGGVMPSPESADLASVDYRFLAACRESSVAELTTTVPERAAGWLDRLVREEAARPLRALDFFRAMVTQGIID